MSSSVCLRVSFFGQGGKSENTANLKVNNYITPSQAYNSQLANMQIGLLSSSVKMSQNYCFSPPQNIHYVFHLFAYQEKWQTPPTFGDLEVLYLKGDFPVFKDGAEQNPRETEKHSVCPCI